MFRNLFAPLIFAALCFSASLYAEEAPIVIEQDTFNLIADITFDEPTQITPSGIKTLTRCYPDLPAGYSTETPSPPPPFQLLTPPPPSPPAPEEFKESFPINASSETATTPFASPLPQQPHQKKRVKKIDPTCDREYTLNYDNIPVIELLRIISEISNTNFVFDNQDINFNISIVSKETSDVNELLASLLQILRMHGLSVVEQGKNVLIYRSGMLSSGQGGQAGGNLAKVSTIVTDDNFADAEELPIITRVFRLYNLNPSQVVNIVRPLLSGDAIVEASEETRHLIVSDITANVDKIGDLIEALDSPNNAFDVAQYKVKSAYPAALITYAREILAPLSQQNPVQLIAQPSSHTIFIVSTPYLINKAIQVLTSLDTSTITPETLMLLPSTDLANNNFFVYKLRYHNGMEVVEALHDIGMNLQRTGLANMDLVNTINSVQWIRANNSIVFSGTDATIARVLALIEEIDTAPKQVYIEVLIIDTTLSNSLNFGVEWVALANEQNKLAFASGFLNPPPAAAPTGSLGIQQPPLYGGARSALNTPPPNAARGGAPGTGGDVPLSSGFGFGIVGNIIRHHGTSFLTMGALVQALETEADTTVVLNPRIMTEDTKEAILFVGQNIPYQTTSTVVRDTGSVTENIQYEDIGVQLRVVPTVTPGNVVTLQIDQSISDIVNTSVTFQNSNGSTQLVLAPTTSKILTSTRVHVPDGAFLVMSGHIRDEFDYTRTGVPCLGTLPLIGPTFSNTTEVRTKRNLILFIRPHVISTNKEAINFTNLEGYEHNCETEPCYIRVVPPQEAPEAQTYPPEKCY